MWGGGVWRRILQAGQRPRVTAWSLARPLREQDLLLQIRKDQPLQTVTVARHPARMLFHAANEKRADGVLREPRAIHPGSHPRRAPAAAQLAHGFCKPAVDGVVVEPLQDTIQGGVIMHAWQLQRFPQFAMFY